MIAGFICAGCLMLLLARLIGRKRGRGSWDRITGKLHVPVGILLPAVLTVHLFTTQPVWDKRSPAVMLSGIVLAAAAVLMLLGWLLRDKVKVKFLRLHRIGAGLMLAALLVHIAGYYIGLAEYGKAVKAISLDGISAAGVADGTYTGHCDVGYINASVEVTVKDGQIEAVNLLEHGHERGEAAELLPESVTDNQTTAVDAVSGATNSSKVILKAIENALQGVE